MSLFLDFEQPIAELQAQIDELRHVSEHNSAVDLNEDIRRLEKKNEELTKKINSALKVALKDPEFIKRQEALGAIVATDKRIEPAEHKAFVADQITKLKTVIDAAGQFAD